MSKVTFDGPNLLMIVDEDITSLDVKTDLYSDWKEWVLLSDNAKYLPAFTTTGGDPIGGGLYTGSTYILINGWKIRPYEGNHTLTLDGNIFGEGGVNIIVPTLGSFTVGVQFRNSTQAQGISTSGGGGSDLTVEDIWSHTPRTLTSGGVTSIVDGVLNAPVAGRSAGSLGESLSNIKTDTTNILINQATVNTLINTLLKYERNRTRVDRDAKTLTVYDDNGTTPLRVFNLRNFDGNASYTEVAERVPQ